MKHLPSILCLLSFLAGSSLFADVPVVVNYTGHLTGEDGRELDAKVMLMAFRLYDRPGTGLTAEKATALWGRQASVTLSGGDFDVNLKDSFGTQLANTRYVSLADAIAAALQEGEGGLYLGLTPANDSNAEIFPRQRLTVVPKAVQARAVRTIPDHFASTNGTFSADALVVNGGTSLQGGASYAATAFGDTATTTFKGGVEVDGTLNAGAVAATKLAADAITVTTAATSGTGSLSATGTLASAGTPVWNGDIKGKVGVITASEISGKVDVPEGAVNVTSLTAGKFVNNATDAGSAFWNHSGTWRLIGDWKTVDAVSETAESHVIRVYDPMRATQVECNSISAGIWQAPCDCLAFFQTFIVNDLGNDPACIQFYILADPGASDFYSITPNAVAMVSNGNGATVESVVPILLRKGQLVKWLGYNNNKAPGSSIEETKQTSVKGISYQPFGWGE